MCVYLCLYLSIPVYICLCLSPCAEVHRNARLAGSWTIWASPSIKKILYSFKKKLIDFGTSLDPDANLMTQANRFKTASWDKPFRNKTLGQTVSRHSPRTNRFKIAAWNETFQNIALGQTVSKQRCRTNRNSTVGQTVSTQRPKTNRFETASHA